MGVDDSPYENHFICCSFLLIWLEHLPLRERFAPFRGYICNLYLLSSSYRSGTMGFAICSDLELESLSEIYFDRL